MSHERPARRPDAADPQLPEPVRSKFSPVEAACVALATPGPPLTPARLRIVTAAATLWSSTLQFPTVRELASSTGRSLSTTIRFPRWIDVQAAVIREEWRALVTGMTEPDARQTWLLRHAALLRGLHPAMLRLPALVRAAVVIAEPGLRTSTAAWAADVQLLALEAEVDLSPALSAAS